MLEGAIEAVAAQIATEIHERLWVLGPLVGQDLIELSMDAQRLRLTATRLAAQLLDDRDDGGELGVHADDIAAETAQDVMCGLWPRSDPPDEWWQTPLGRAVARSVGLDSSEAVSASVAAAMLGVSRGRVYQLIAAGKLDRHPDGGVVRSDILRRLADESS